MKRASCVYAAFILLAGTGRPMVAAESVEPVQISGIYPHLAAFNGNDECGIGAVVPWAGRLWFITYPPHARRGSSDKLYSIDEQLELTIHPESVGGTHANRLIHRETNQLLMGPYVISAEGQVRAFDVKQALPGRLTATARHLTDPAHKVYYVDMEGPIWEADVLTLETRKLFEKPLPGWHGKGAYTAQGRLVVANNGEHGSLGDLDRSAVTAELSARGPEDAGVLGEWDDREWRIVERRQFTDVTGPGGIRGNEQDSDPLWATGWDRRSVILKLLDGGEWSTFRLPKASHCFDPRHGWFTEWPRIREVADGKFLVTMHGTIFDFPRSFSRANTAGIRPICTHLRYIPDFCGWNGRLVLAADDTSIMQNPLAGQSQSNLWFGTLDELRNWGPAQGWGGPWVDDQVAANQPSDPYLFSGYARRMVHLRHDEPEIVQFTLEVDASGHGEWQALTTIEVPPGGYAYHLFPAEAPGGWIRVRTDRDCGAATCYFHYLPPQSNGNQGTSLFTGLASITETDAWTGGLVRPAKQNRNLQFLARSVNAAGTAGEEAYYEVNETLQFSKIESPERIQEVRAAKAIEPQVHIDEASVKITGPDGVSFRLPKGDAAFDEAGPQPLRSVREAVSERSLANIHGTFYEIPRAEAATKEQLDLRRIKPVASHGYRITDFCTWRGLLVLSGTQQAAQPNGHYFDSAEAGLWFGHIDDLWQLGKSVGRGGPWKATPVKSGMPSDPYLMTGYDRKSLALSHDRDSTVSFAVEVDFDHTGWQSYRSFDVPAGQTLTHVFPDGYSAHWLRVISNHDCHATAWCVYE